MTVHQAQETQPIRQLRDLPMYNPGSSFVGALGQLMGDPLLFHLTPYRQFGPIYRMRVFTHQHVVMAGAEANEFIWRNSDLWNYGQRMVVFRAGYDDTIVLQLDGEVHRKKHRRQAMAQKYSALMPLAPRMTRTLAQEISAVPEGRADLRLLCKRLTSCMTSQGLMQIDLPAGMDTKIDAFSHRVLVTDVVNMVLGYRLGAELEPLLRLWFRRPSYQRLMNELLTMIYQALAERERNAPTEDDIVSNMLKDQPADQPPLTLQEIATDILFLFPAGTEPTSHLLLWSLMYLYQNPGWLAELREELRTWSPDTLKNLNDWPKLKATLLEVERVRPLLPNFFLLAARDFAYQGVRVPKGTPIVHAAALTHFLPEVYDDPLDFKPQRFLEGSGYPPPHMHGTYGGGAHSCLGQSFARVQALLGIAHIVSNYDLVFEFSPSFRPAMGVVLTPVEPELPVRLVPRSPTAEHNLAETGP